MEKRIKRKSYFVILASSIIINLLFMLKWYVGGELELSWSRKAAEEAEKVAANSCSGHGRSYLDGLVLHGKEPICECNTCYGGSDCSLFISDCAANADGGDPYFLEPFWMQHAASSAIVVAGWHRMGYTVSDHSFISKELENQIRKVHAIVGNAVTEGKHIIFGVGTTQLLNAAVYSLSPDNASSPTRVLVSIPYYPVYQRQTKLFQTPNYEFDGDVSLWVNNSDIATNNYIEFVTSPNNPDGHLKKGVLHSPNSKAIYDRVYYWPHFTAIPASADEDIMLFSISKLTGHAGTRFGWAVIKDKSVFQRMSWYLTLNTMGVSRDTQLRALKLLKVVLQGSGKEIFEFGYKTLSSRWAKLTKTLSASKRFSLQSIGPQQYCSHFQNTREPSPAYAWLKCEREEDKNCYEVLEAANIIGRAGSFFGAEDRYVRLSLIKTEDDFDQLLHMLEKLVSNEGGIRTV